MSIQGSEDGRWFVVVPTQTSRKTELRIICRQPNSIVDGKFIPGSETEVTFNYSPVKEGMFNEEPALEGVGYDNEVFHFLQAVVDEAAKQGIRARVDDQSGELKATKIHLQDMRDIVHRVVK